MDTVTGSEALGQRCISCKKGVSEQQTLYQCNCCCIVICPECVCTAKVVTAGLVKLPSVASSPTLAAVEQVVAAQIPPQRTDQSVVASRPAVALGSIKRKPVNLARSASVVSPIITAPVPSPQPEVPAPQSYVAPQTLIQPQLWHNPGTLPTAQSQFAAIQSQPLIHTRPELQHSATAPLPSKGPDQSPDTQHSLASQTRSLSLPSNTFKDKRKSVSNLFSVETGKKIAKNKWVRAGARYGANLAIRAVVNDSVADLVSNINIGSGSNDNGNGTDFANATDSNTGDSNGDGGVNLAQQILLNSVSASIPTPDILQPNGGDGANFAQQILLNSVNASVASPDGLQSLVPDLSGVDYTALFQQQQAALNLSNAVQQQNFAIANMANSAIQQSNTFQQNAQFQASQTLNWGTDAAVPGVTANTYQSSNPAATPTAGFANANFQTQLANAGAAV